VDLGQCKPLQGTIVQLCGQPRLLRLLLHGQVHGQLAQLGVGLIQGAGLTRQLGFSLLQALQHGVETRHQGTNLLPRVRVRDSHPKVPIRGDGPAALGEPQDGLRDAPAQAQRHEQGRP
jgi:hypothetical protein